MPVFPFCAGVKELVKSGCVDVDCVNSVNGWSPLHWAAKRGDSAIVTLLLNKGGANPNILSAGRRRENREERGGNSHGRKLSWQKVSSGQPFNLYIVTYSGADLGFRIFSRRGGGVIYQPFCRPF